ncbi:hypothetical protein Q5P01_004439 [Channa striata]|uniref:Uncharacterized protein n=1 Tax=Channa striata TaxID=64152 RepID=A0AA88NHQ0_CHASR|nr:hypothetical protein Q5P01_004439 [Channa striata]
MLERKQRSELQHRAVCWCEPQDEGLDEKQSSRPVFPVVIYLLARHNKELMDLSVKPSVTKLVCMRTSKDVALWPRSPFPGEESSFVPAQHRQNQNKAVGSVKRPEDIHSE